jgi:hypothetical protein
MMFDCLVQTDGFGVCFVFARKKRESTYGSTETVFKLEEFSQSEVERFSYLLQLTQEEKACSQPPLDISLKNIKSGPALAKSENIILDPSGDNNLLMV